MILEVCEEPTVHSPLHHMFTTLTHAAPEAARRKSRKFGSLSAALGAPRFFGAQQALWKSAFRKKATAIRKRPAKFEQGLMASIP